jgi:hypothetical protein
VRSSRKQDFFLGTLLFLALVPTATLLAAEPEASIRVKVEVDDGPQGRATERKKVLLPKGSTVVDATKAVAKMEQGFVCCDAKDVRTLNGVRCDPKKNGWWLYEVNGKMGQVAAHRYVLKEGDRVTWRYRVLKDTRSKKKVLSEIGPQKGNPE